MSKNVFIGTPKIAPCMNCENRHEGCHSVCDSYRDFSEENKKERHKRYVNYIPGEYRYARK